MRNKNMRKEKVSWCIAFEDVERVPMPGSVSIMIFWGGEEEEGSTAPTPSATSILWFAMYKGDRESTLGFLKVESETQSGCNSEY